MKRFRFHMLDGRMIEQTGVDFRDAVQNQGFSPEEANSIVGYEEIS